MQIHFEEISVLYLCHILELSFLLRASLLFGHPLFGQAHLQQQTPERRQKRTPGTPPSIYRWPVIRKQEYQTTTVLGPGAGIVIKEQCTYAPLVRLFGSARKLRLEGSYCSYEGGILF